MSPRKTIGDITTHENGDFFLNGDAILTLVFEQRCARARNQESLYESIDGSDNIEANFGVGGRDEATLENVAFLKPCLKQQHYDQLGSFRRFAFYMLEMLTSLNPVGSQQKKVQFSTLSIREHTVVEGDHPYCRQPPALSLGWHIAHDTPDIPIDLYEKMRAELCLTNTIESDDSIEADSLRLPRRHRRQLRLSASERQEWLGNCQCEDNLNANIDKLPKLWLSV